MMHEQINKELLSALVDGELRGPELEQALACAESAEGCGSWGVYHLVGDVLRSPDLAHHSQHDLLTGLRAQIAAEPPLQRHLQPGQLQAVSAPAALEQAQAGRASADPAANAAVFRWKVAAGCASVAAIAALSWNLLGQAGNASLAPQLADAGQSQVVKVVTQNGEVLRDPRLDALMASHQQYASRAALQAPAEFLRNASLSAGVPSGKSAP